MSFGVGIGDVATLGQLAEKLYTQVYKVARAAPNELNALATELGALTSSIKLLEVEISDPKSTLRRGGQERAETLGRVIKETTRALSQLEDITRKYDIVNDTVASKWKRKFAALKFTTDLSAIEKIRAKITQQYGMIQLLLTSAGNSSLERIENESRILEAKVSEIKSLILALSLSSNVTGEHHSASEDVGSPVLSTVVHNSMTSKIVEKFMKHAETHGSWLSIGIDSWLTAGTWWLKKAHHYLWLPTVTPREINIQAYADLLKASWILIDIIHEHPQRPYLQSGLIQMSIQHLADGIKTDFKAIREASLKLPDEEKVLSLDLDPWKLPPSISRDSGKPPSDLSEVPVEFSGAVVIFQCFASYYTSTLAIEGIECFLLVVFHPVSLQLVFIARNASGTILAIYKYPTDDNQHLIFDKARVKANDMKTPVESGIFPVNQQEGVLLQELYTSARGLYYLDSRSIMNIDSGVQEPLHQSIGPLVAACVLEILVKTKAFGSVHPLEVFARFRDFIHILESKDPERFALLQSVEADFRTRPGGVPERDILGVEGDFASNRAYVKYAVMRMVHNITAETNLLPELWPAGTAFTRTNLSSELLRLANNDLPLNPILARKVIELYGDQKHENS